jgi:hypothetical protein
MKRFIGLLMILIVTSCAHKAEVRAPELVRTERYSYLKDGDGRVYVVTTSTKDFDEAMKTIRPGPASVDKLDLWVITPLGPVTKKDRAARLE